MHELCCSCYSFVRLTLDSASHRFFAISTTFSFSRASINRMYPAFYELIDSSISNKDRNIIFSVLRMERNLRWRINAKFDSSGHNFDSDPFLRLKVHQVVKCLATTMDSCQRILVGKPRMNCYAIAYLCELFLLRTIFY